MAISPTDLNALLAGTPTHTAKPKKNKQKNFNVPVMHGETAMMRLCPGCGRTRTTSHVLGFCATCEGCISCGARPWIDKNSMLCENCVCQKCGGTTAPIGMDRDSGELACAKCRKIVTCNGCGKAYADTLTRGDRVPEKCNRCSARKISKCYFCNGKARGFISNDRIFPMTWYYVCQICEKSRCCWVANCRPVKQCKKCKAHQREVDQAEHAIPARWHSPFYCKNELKFWEAKPITLRRVNRSPRLFGVEIEVAGANNATEATVNKMHKVMKTWGGNIVFDGSLRTGGFEVTSAPAGGDVFLKQVDEITDALRAAGAFVDESCGLHVHVDARDHSYADLRKLIQYYAFVEPAMLRMQPYERILMPNPNNNKYYAMPCGDLYLKGLGDTSSEAVSKMYTAITREKLLTNIYGEQAWRPPRKEHFSNAKYHAANFHSWFYEDRKTIEFRMHTGTVVPRKIKDWAMLCGAVVNEAYQRTEKTIPPPGPVDDAIAELMRIAPTPRIKTYIQTRLETHRKRYDDYEKTRSPQQLGHEPLEIIEDEPVNDEFWNEEPVEED